MQKRGGRGILNHKGDSEVLIVVILISMLCLLVIAAIYVMVNKAS